MELRDPFPPNIFGQKRCVMVIYLYIKLMIEQMQSQAKVQCHNAVWHTSSKGIELLEDLLVKYKHIRQKNG